jgi:sugar phosphate isomerase/epimerase
MNQYSTKLDFDKAVRMYHEAGYGGIGVWFDGMLEYGADNVTFKGLMDYGVDEAVRLLKEVPIKVTHVIYAGPFNQTSESEYVAAREKDREKIRAAGRVGAETVLALTGPADGISPEEGLRLVVRGLCDLAETAREAGVKIGLEPLHFNLYKDSFLFRLTDALDIIEEVDHPSVGVFFDVYHVWHEVEILNTIQRAKGKIVGCHICDFRRINRHIADRVFMGDGVIPIRELLNALKDAGWDRWYDIEIISHELWQMDPRDFLKLGMEKYKKLWEEPSGAVAP